MSRRSSKENTLVKRIVTSPGQSGKIHKPSKVEHYGSRASAAAYGTYVNLGEVEDVICIRRTTGQTIARREPPSKMDKGQGIEIGTRSEGRTISNPLVFVK